MIELVASLAAIAVLAGALLSRLGYYQEAAERAQMEYEANTLKLALQLRIGHDLARQLPLDYLGISEENPVHWLDVPMQGYRGELGPTQAQAVQPPGWYFDRDRRELVYVPLRSSHLAADSSGRKRVRFKVTPVRAESGKTKRDPALIGLQLLPVEPYRWR